jgi:hypothetical protein
MREKPEKEVGKDLAWNIRYSDDFRCYLKLEPHKWSNSVNIAIKYRLLKSLWPHQFNRCKERYDHAISEILGGQGPRKFLTKGYSPPERPCSTPLFCATNTRLILSRIWIHASRANETVFWDLWEKFNKTPETPLTKGCDNSAGKSLDSSGMGSEKLEIS